jgi:hypothetical protein
MHLNTAARRFTLTTAIHHHAHGWTAGVSVFGHDDLVLNVTQVSGHHCLHLTATGTRSVVKLDMKPSGCHVHYSGECLGLLDTRLTTNTSTPWSPV